MRTLLFLLSACFPFVAFAQGNNSRSMMDSLHSMKSASTKIVYIGGKPTTQDEHQADNDSIKEVINAFYYDQFRNFQDPDAPYFLFMSKEAGVAMGVGGGVRMRAFYDWGGAMPGTAFSPMLIPIPANPANMKHFGTTPSGTYLFFRVMGHHKLFGHYQFYIESNFTGYEGRDFRLKKAYAMIKDFTFGYASSSFSDPAALPPVVDAAGVNNKISVTSVLARYMPTFKKRWSVGVSVETPETAIGADQKNTSVVSSWLPDFAALVQYQWAQGQHVRLSGIIRTLSYRNNIDRQNHNLAGWGLHLSSVAHPVGSVTTYLNFNYGKGYASMGGDLMYGGGYDLVGDPDRPGTLYAPASFGWSAGVQYNFTPTLFASVSASETRYLPKHGVASDEYKYGVFACANIFWYITSRISVAAELDWGYRKNFSGQHRQARRTNVMAAFSF